MYCGWRSQSVTTLKRKQSTATTGVIWWSAFGTTLIRADPTSTRKAATATRSLNGDTKTRGNLTFWSAARRVYRHLNAARLQNCRITELFCCWYVLSSMSVVVMHKMFKTIFQENISFKYFARVSIFSVCNFGSNYLVQAWPFPLQYVSMWITRKTNTLKRRCTKTTQQRPRGIMCWILHQTLMCYKVQPKATNR